MCRFFLSHICNGSSVFFFLSFFHSFIPSPSLLSLALSIACCKQLQLALALLILSSPPLLSFWPPSKRDQFMAQSYGTMNAAHSALPSSASTATIDGRSSLGTRSTSPNQAAAPKKHHRHSNDGERYSSDESPLLNNGPHHNEDIGHGNEVGPSAGFWSCVCYPFVAIDFFLSFFFLCGKSMILQAPPLSAPQYTALVFQCLRHDRPSPLCCKKRDPVRICCGRLSFFSPVPNSFPPVPKMMTLLFHQRSKPSPRPRTKSQDPGFCVSLVSTTNLDTFPLFSVTALHLDDQPR